MAKPRKPATSKSKFVKARLPDELRARLDAVHERHGGSDTEDVVRLLDAFCTAVEEEDAKRWPIRILFDQARPNWRAAEDGEGYTHSGPPPAKPPKPPDASSRTRGAGPDHRVSKKSA